VKANHGTYFKLFSIVTIAALLTGIVYIEADKDNLKKQINKETSFWDIYSEEELKANDFLLYRVDCGNVLSHAKTGAFQSTCDQPYGPDEITKRKWGYEPKDYMVSVKDKYGTGLNTYKWEISEDAWYDNNLTGFYYNFEVPKGEYEITLGFYNPFSARPIYAQIEDNMLVDGEKILKYKLTECTAYTSVEDSELNLKVFNPQRGVDAMKNPILSYIEVRVVPKFGRELLLSYMESLKGALDNQGLYTPESYESFTKAYQDAEQVLIENNGSTKENIEFRKSYFALKTSFEALEEIKVYTSFNPAKPWTDTKGNLIQAHGGQVQKLTFKDKETGESVTKWWWVGEDKSKGAHGGICAYSSDDLYNWQFEGVVMRNVNSREELDNDEYFKELYKGLSKEELDNVYTCLSASTAIIERPKLIYNEKTDKYIIWFHADGPTATSNSSYAAASAGVAISDTPYGPFKFIDRYRLNVCPDDQEDFHPESKGMARDMNLFVDDDKTAYIIYSSEENLTLYISKLNDEYTYLATPVNEAKYGEDFIRLFPGAQREAPAVFKKDKTYYLVSSGCTGWAPNQARYYKASSMLGEWTNEGDPCIGDTQKTTFDSQSTCVFKADNGTYVFMADRWNPEDLKNSRYIWLPVIFNDDGSIALEYTEEWTLK